MLVVYGKNINLKGIRIITMKPPRDETNQSRLYCLFYFIQHRGIMALADHIQINYSK